MSAFFSCNVQCRFALPKGYRSLSVSLPLRRGAQGRWSGLVGVVWWGGVGGCLDNGKGGRAGLVRERGGRVRGGLVCELNEMSELKGLN